MKRILLTLISVMTLCLSLSAQTYNMVITKADGSIVLVPADEVSNVSFVAQEPVVDVPRHFDVIATIGNHGGMNKDKKGHLRRSVTSLETGATIDFKNEGGEITDYTLEAICKGKYFYQVPISGDRFSKLQFVDNKIKVIQEQPFVTNTYTARNYTHAWLNDNTLVIMACNGDGNKIIWTKLNTDDMSIIGEGELDLALSEGYKLFTTSGILTYRKSDNKLFYFYYQKTAKRNGVSEKNFHVVTINPETMAVEHNNVCPIEGEMAGSAYGELLQQITFFDEADNLYIACFKDVTEKLKDGKLLRIKNGEFNIESDYDGFPNSDGKLLTVQYMGNGKVFCYSRHDDETLGTGIDDYAHYYSVIDLNAKTRTRLAFNGTEIPYSSGLFSQRSAVDRAAGKVYFGVNTADAAPHFYIYDIKTGNLTKGIDMVEGYYFDYIRIVED